MRVFQVKLINNKLKNLDINLFNSKDFFLMVTYVLILPASSKNVEHLEPHKNTVAFYL